jgi:hypothetical protein
MNRPTACVIFSKIVGAYPLTILLLFHFSIASRSESPYIVASHPRAAQQVAQPDQPRSLGGRHSVRSSLLQWPARGWPVSFALGPLRRFHGVEQRLSVYYFYVSCRPESKLKPCAQQARRDLQLASACLLFDPCDCGA